MSVCECALMCICMCVSASMYVCMRVLEVFEWEWWQQYSSKKQLTNKTNERVCTNRITRSIHFLFSLSLCVSLSVFIRYDFSLPTSFSSGSLHDDRPVSIRSSKRSHWILYSSSFTVEFVRQTNKIQHARTHTVQSWAHSRCSPILQSTLNGIELYSLVLCVYTVVE